MSANVRRFSVMVLGAGAALGVAIAVQHETGSAHGRDAHATNQADETWREAEGGILTDYVQLTFSDRFSKAGEAYFSPDDSKLIFQAIEQPRAGEKPAEFYSMYVADVAREDARGGVRGGGGAVTGIENIRRISPEGSSNTCGWFHPTDPDIVIFASTIVPPARSEAPGYQRGSSVYKWMFPSEMRIVRCDLRSANGTPESLEVIAGDMKHYHAEGSLSADARHLLYCSLESNEGDLFVLDLQTGAKHRIVQARGYDGGPFFSPDGKRICYRSDREGDGLLQIFVADLAFNEKGEIVGIEREYQLTDAPWVNWCPFWTRDGRRLIYASSELGESNFEINMIDADPGNLPGSNGTIKYGTGKRRLTHFAQTGDAPASDVLPALSHDGKWMIWTSRRGPDGEVHLWAARSTLDPDAPWKKLATAPQPARAGTQDRITIEDPDTGRIFVYDMATHTVFEYDPRTHALTEVTNAADLARVRELHQPPQ